MTLRSVLGAVAVLVVLVATSGCATPDDHGVGSADSSPPPVDASSAPTSATTRPEGAAAASAPPVPVRERLAVLVVDDRPAPGASYRREDWPHWEDVDGNGCDARQDTLIRWSTSPPSLDPDRRCKVVAGTWVSPYDGVGATSPGAIEIDHLVPLAEAHRSGGWRWDPALRRRFANDPIELVAASSASNRAKGDDRPDEWRPARVATWCAYADGWVTVKGTYGLTVTTTERDALGQMLDTCATADERWPAP